MIAGIIGPVVALILTFADTVISPWFVWTQNALSDLGVHPYSYLFNYSLIFEGVMNFFLALGLMTFYKLRKYIVVALMISGISLALVGIFVETYHPYHLMFALIYFLLFPISIIMFGLQTGKRFRSQAVMGYGLAGASLITIVLGIMIDFGLISGVNIGLAIPEMVEAVLLGIWSIAIASFSLLTYSAKNATRSQSEAEPETYH